LLAIAIPSRLIALTRARPRRQRTTTRFHP
jgi:hypothetical protein